MTATEPCCISRLWDLSNGQWRVGLAYWRRAGSERLRTGQRRLASGWGARIRRCALPPVGGRLALIRTVWSRPKGNVNPERLGANFHAGIAGDQDHPVVFGELNDLCIIVRSRPEIVSSDKEDGSILECELGKYVLAQQCLACW